MPNQYRTSQLAARREELESLAREKGVAEDERLNTLEGSDALFVAGYATVLGMSVRQALDEVTPLAKLEYGQQSSHSDDSEQ